MTIAQVVSLNLIDSFAPVQPYVYEARPGGLELADFWTTTFGVVDESRDYTIVIKSFVRDFNVSYNEVLSFNDCVAQEGSFFWDNTNQILYVHFEHEHEGWTATYQYGTFFGFSDSRVVYIDDQEYLPLIDSVPSIAQSQDIVNYNKLAFINGRLTLNNRARRLEGSVAGQLDAFITADLYNNDVFLYYLPDEAVSEIDEADSSDLVGLAAFYIEDYNIGLTEISLDLQDKRKSQNVTIPSDKFLTSDYPNIGDEAGGVIPLMYGEVREARAVPTNGETTSGDVSYRVALLLTVLGTVQVNIDKIWTTVSTASVTLSTGEFTLSAANGRDSNGAVRDCRVLLPTGIAITYTTDIIKDLNDRYLGIPYLSSNYDTTEWEAEEVALTSGGWVFDSEILLFEAIRIVQAGSSKGFRYEILPDGRRTIRIDDPDRAVSGRVEPVDILNRSEMPVSTDNEQVFAIIELAYNKSFNSGKFQRITDDTYRNEVLARYKQINSLPVETLLNGDVEAAAAALDRAGRFKNIPEIMELVLMGAEFLPKRIYDMIDIEATPDYADADTLFIEGRQYYGFKKGKIVSIAPNINSKINTVRFQFV